MDERRKQAGQQVFVGGVKDESVTAHDHRRTGPFAKLQPGLLRGRDGGLAVDGLRGWIRRERKGQRSADQHEVIRLQMQGNVMGACELTLPLAHPAEEQIVALVEGDAPPAGALDACPEGGRGIDALIRHVAAFQPQFPGAYFKSNRLIAHRGQLLSEWTMCNKDGFEVLRGHSYARFNEQGRLTLLAGFWVF